jgi:hypothetical protein
MPRSVRLDRLPTGLHFPVELSTKISFDAARQRLQFEGFMSKTDFDKLVRLHNDLAYQRALQELFQTCTFTPVSTGRAPSNPRRLPIVFASLTAAAAFVVLGLLLWLRH